jgi:hypothetical protein
VMKNGVLYVAHASRRAVSRSISTCPAVDTTVDAARLEARATKSGLRPNVLQGSVYEPAARQCLSCGAGYLAGSLLPAGFCGETQKPAQGRSSSTRNTTQADCQSAAGCQPAPQCTAMGSSKVDACSRGRIPVPQAASLPHKTWMRVSGSYIAKHWDLC